MGDNIRNILFLIFLSSYLSVTILTGFQNAHFILQVSKQMRYFLLYQIDLP